jgi:hypothetical protein
MLKHAAGVALLIFLGRRGMRISSWRAARGVERAVAIVGR